MHFLCGWQALRLIWVESQRSLLAAQAKQWSDQVLSHAEHAGFQTRA
jgi:hypothetical protein